MLHLMANMVSLVKKKEQIQLHLIMMVPECLLLETKSFNQNRIHEFH